MFAKTIVDSDAFLDMPVSSQNLYFHLAMRADDDGFLNNPKKVQRMVNASDDDLRVLCSKSFIIPFESGVIVIKHWRMSNYLRADRYKPTVYKEEFAQLSIKENGAYSIADAVGIPDGNHLATQVGLGKVSIGKDSIKKSERKALPHYGEVEPVYLSDDEISKLHAKYGKMYIDAYINKISLWEPKDGKRPKNDYMTILRWIDKDNIPVLPPPPPECPHCGVPMIDGCCRNKECPQYN